MRAARRIANSLLVKTALFGGDPNWGRILQTVGAARVAIALERAVVTLGGVAVFRNGSPTGDAARRRAGRALAEARRSKWHSISAPDATRPPSGPAISATTT